MLALPAWPHGGQEEICDEMVCATHSRWEANRFFWKGSRWAEGWDPPRVLDAALVCGPMWPQALTPLDGEAGESVAERTAVASATVAQCLGRCRPTAAVGAADEPLRGLYVLDDYFLDPGKYALPSWLRWRAEPLYVDVSEGLFAKSEPPAPPTTCHAEFFMKALCFTW